MRIQADTQALASYGIGIDTLRTAIAAANANSAKGSFDGPKRSYTINANDQLLTADDYRKLIVAYKNGAPVRLIDVAQVVESAENTRLGAWAGKNGELRPAIILNVQRQPGANVIATVDAIKKQLPDLHRRPAGAACASTCWPTARPASAPRSHHVEIELLLAVVLVVLVIFAFLHSPRATVIASLAVPISLIGTCGAMYLLGYSLNNLSLMALTIATGFVVDDAIVMIENISRHLEEGEHADGRRAARRARREIGFTIISLTVSLIAVLIPLLFMGDVVGRLFREFAVTLAITILISAVVSLTLVPMMSARWLKPRDEAADENKRRHRRAPAAAASTASIDRYDRAPDWVLDHQGADAARRARHAGADGAALPVHPQGPVPDPGHRPAAGARRRPPRTSRTRAWPSCSRRRPRESWRTRRSRTSARFVGVDAANNTMLHTGRMLINLKSDHGEQAEVMERLRERVAQGGRRHALPAADAGPDDRRRDRADRSSASRSKAPTPRP